MTFDSSDLALLVVALDTREAELIKRIHLCRNVDPWTAREMKVGEVLRYSEDQLDKVRALRARILALGPEVAKAAMFTPGGGP